jgi:hypothetical protein
LYNTLIPYCYHSHSIFGKNYASVIQGCWSSSVLWLVDDPCEEDKLRDILPERVEALLKYLPSFVNSASVVATSNEQADDYDDPQVLRRLRDLGEIECLS